MKPPSPPRAGRHFLQIPGPTNLPERVLRAMDRPTLDHRGPELAGLVQGVLEELRGVFQTTGPVVVFPGSGTGAWEAALVNTLSPQERVLFFDHGVFANSWARMARKLGLAVEVLPCDWRLALDPRALEARLADDARHEIRAVAVVHNETSTGVTNPIVEIRRAMDAARHPALLLVDTVSSLAAMDYRHDEWGVDVTVCCSQKGLMLPPGLGFNAVSDKALAAHRSARLPRSYWDWSPMLETNDQGLFPYTPATHLLYGLEEALALLAEEGLPRVFARHHRLAEAARRAVGAWGLGIYARNDDERSQTLTAVTLPEGVDADSLRRRILEHFDLSLGAGLGPLRGKVFRIGHLGSLNDLMLAGTLCGIEMGLVLAQVPCRRGGVAAALDWLATTTDEDLRPGD